MKNDKLRGEGPWLFELDELGPGETAVFDLRNMTHRGRARYFRPKLPLDQAQITNGDSSTVIEAEFNGLYPTQIPANAVDSFSETGITRVTITNTSDSNTISAGDVVLELSKSAYGADERARDQAERGTVSQVFEKFTGVTL